MDRRVGILVALLVSFAFVAGRLTGHRGAGVDPKSLPVPAGDTGSPAPAVASSTSATLSAPPTEVRPHRTTDGAAGGIAPRPAGSEAGPLANQVVLEGLRPAGIRVRVVDADGEPVAGVAVCAIPEGTAHPGGGGTPDAETDASGRATVTVPAAGRYAVTVQADLRIAVREGVRATKEGQPEVEFVLGRMANVEVRRTGIAGRANWLVQAVAPGPTLADGTVVGAPLHRAESRDDEVVVLTLPEHVPFTLRVTPNWGDPPWAGLTSAGPLEAEVSAPGSFVAEFRDRTATDDLPTAVRVRVDVAILPATGALPLSGRVAYAFRQRVRDSASEDSEGWIDWGPEDATLSVSHAPSGWPPQTPGRIEWTVAGVPGSIDVPAGRAGEEIRLAGRVRIPAAAVETGVRVVEVVDEAGAPVPVGGPEETSADLFAQDGDLGFTSAEEAENHVRTWLRGRVGQTLTAVRGNWRVSRPGSTTTDGTLRLQLELGGFLLVHVRTPLRQGLGRLTVERMDGGWLGTYTRDAGLPDPADDHESRVYAAEAVNNGTLLGPLPPGDVELRFRLGGVEVGRATARVVGGEVSVLTIR